MGGVTDKDRLGMICLLRLRVSHAHPHSAEYHGLPSAPEVGDAMRAALELLSGTGDQVPGVDKALTPDVITYLVGIGIFRRHEPVNPEGRHIQWAL